MTDKNITFDVVHTNILNLIEGLIYLFIYYKQIMFIETAARTIESTIVKNYVVVNMGSTFGIYLK